MNYNKKTRPVGSTTKRAARNGSTPQFLCKNGITPRHKGQVKISSLLGVGQGEAIPRRDIERLTGLDGRMVRLIIERERRRGIPIVSDNKTGYYLASDSSEAHRFARSMRHRAGEILLTADAIERAAEVLAHGE